MIIVINLPELFYHEDDEEHFFQWLYGIPAYVKVVGVGHTLEVTLKDRIGRKSLYSLIGLLTRYGIDPRPLAALCHPKIEEWFTKNTMYWHKPIFGRTTRRKKPRAKPRGRRKVAS